MRRYLATTALFFALPASHLFAAAKQFSASPADVRGGYITERIPLQAYAKPTVQLSGAAFTSVPALPKGVACHPADSIQLTLGMERAQPFVLVRVPAFSRNAQGKLQLVASFTLDITEAASTVSHAAGGPSAHALAKTTVVSSPLATGTWFKISVPARGVYKVDYNFIQQKLGVNPANINPANIRFFGNGGTMLSENNAVSRPDNLVENAISVSASGATFGTSDYFTFYAPGPMGWTKDSADQKFVHYKNLYADSSYYFVSFDAGAGLRISTAAAAGTANETVTDFNEYAVHEQDLYNPGQFGKSWVGEAFSGLNNTLSRDFSFTLGTVTDALQVHLVTDGRSTIAGSVMNLTVNGTSRSYSYGAVSGSTGDTPYTTAPDDFTLTPSAAGSTAVFHFTYTPTISDGTGYLDFIEINYRRALTFPGGFLVFRDWKSVGAGKTAAYQVQNAGSNLQVWDITNPLQPARMAGSLNGSTYTFTQDASSLHEFVALDGSQYGTPQFSAAAPNQNIHGATGRQDLVIVSHPDFMDAANNLAAYHRQHDGMNVLAVSTTQVYNEFSSGGQDISAIRDMMRLFYTRANGDTTQMPRYLLLFGDASYDYKTPSSTTANSGNQNFVPTFESAETIDADNAYVVDDFFGFLDDNENIEDYTIANTLDIGVGRIPVQTATQAAAATAKVVSYTSPAALGPWRIADTYIGDNEDDAGTHLQDAEDMAATVNATTTIYNDSKVYLDNLPFVSTPAGTRCPDANKAIDDQIYQGTFLMNYNGHGSTTTLAHERILTDQDFNAWRNVNQLPFMVTATCDYSRYDNPSYVSDGEQLILKAQAGTIAMLTTTDAVYAADNHVINQDFLQAQFTQRNGTWNTFGDAFRIGKNVTYSHAGSDLINFRRFVLLGDPALTPSFPQYFVHTESMTDLATQQPTDTLRALGSYTITGNVTDANKQTLSSFNGNVFVTFYDKARTVTLTTKETGATRTFKMQDNIVYKGTATVTAGHFSFSFIAPKDLDYSFGHGKISYYADNGVTDAAGSDSSKTVGGFSDNAAADNDGPIVKPYMNDTLFRDGAITGANTLLYVSLSDQSGINVSGNSIGHDITAVLDGNNAAPYTLNKYYRTLPNSYQRGYVSFPITGLSDGAHTFVVKAWDVYDNSGEGTVHFIVSDGKIVDIRNLMNYPNPFSDITHFVFEHNHPDEALKVQISIYSTDGKEMKIIRQTFTPSGSHSNEITWDGTGDNGAKLPDGVYPYRLILTTASGIQATAYEKLVLIR